MDENETYYLLDDDDVRNARDHRQNRPGLIRSPGATPSPRPVRILRSTASPAVVMTAPAAPAATGGGLLGNLDRGELVEIAAQALSALMPLPAAPAATGDVRDVANQTLYLTALATHAKRAEQLRTLGSVLGKLLD